MIVSPIPSFEIRRIFLEFFRERGHQIVPSAPIVVKNDPTLMFTNAGMNQFKDLFLGNSAIRHHRVADTQKCLRVSGKHNDLEEVGVDTYHHTMFEMLGNWSFGDPANPSAGYFKKEAIQWSWELLHDKYGISADRIYATVFEGDPANNIPMDQEAYEEWAKYLPRERILLGNKKDNFWEMGDTGPCGPCTEIHVDCRSDEEREQVEGSTLVNQDHPQVIEIWNNVFIQFNRIKDGSLQPLPARHVDTGMGFERLVRVLQGKQSNYDTDLFEPTLRKIEELSGAAYEGTMVKKDIAFRVIADHIRAISFTIADGQLPSNAGAGYVIRRILRRAIRYYFSFLDCQEPLLASLVPVIAEQFKDVFPELHQQIDFVQRVIREEELSFLKTLDSGIRRFEQIVAESAGTLPGEKVFELMDTFGFPVDLSVLMAQEKGRVIDMAGFEAALQLQKERSRASAQIENEDWVVVNEVPEMSFVGYDNLNVETSIVKYRSFKAKDAIGHQVVLKETPFYAESGGQVGDTGFLMFGHERVNVLNTKKENDLIIHTVDHLPQNAAQEVVAQVDEFRRNKITVNHSATHLMHAALRQILGPHVVQKGSLVNDVHLRFDFSHFAKVTDEEIAQIEDIVNEKIRENIPVIIKYMDKDEALRTGAMALFGEKYGNIVRVVIIDPAYSIELCGGCHVGYTGEIGLFKITSESAVAAGVRRVEAMTGQAALQYLNAYVEEVRQVRQLMGNPKEVITKLNDLIAENKSLRKEMEKMEADKALRLQHELSESVRSNSAGVNYIISRTELSDNKLLKNIGFNLARESGDALVALINCYDEKVTIQINISESLADKKIYNAGELVRQLAPLIGGGGGGQVGYATAGGNNVSGIDSVLEQLTQLVE
ncbi:MAG TPA: alanine--tRNA ligase [Saprospiraceae bacterium]|nr:alanine--tRNA ligase [Saprospiraceae bacterium]